MSSPFLDLLEHLEKAVPLQRDLLESDVGMGTDGHHTPEFQQWFQGSVVRHGDGRPRVVYHGTNVTHDFTRLRGAPGREHSIRPPDQRLGPHFAADPHVANYFTNKYTNERFAPRVIPALLSIKHPRVLSVPGTMSMDEADATAFKRDMAAVVLPHRPELLHRIRQANPYSRLPSYDEAMKNEGRRHEVMQAMKDPKAKLTRKDITDGLAGTFGSTEIASGLAHESKSDRSVRRDYRHHLRAMGHDGWAYQNTSPMETAGAVDHTAYIPMHPAQIKGVFNARPSRSTRIDR